MKKITDDTKMTLTLKQLKALVKEAKKVKQPRYTIAQYCDMKGLDADKLMAAIKAHRSILSPPVTDRTMFLKSALDTYAERYADEMNEGSKTQVNEGPGAGYTVEMKDITLLNATATVADGAWKVKGDCRFIGHAEGYDWSTEELEYEGEFEFQVNTYQINRYVEKYLLNWDPEDVTDEDIKEMLERTDAYSIEDISQMIGAGWVHVKWDGVLEVDQAGFDLDDRYLSGHNAEVGDFDIELYDKGSAPEEDCNNCYFSIEAHDDFALDVETAYELKDEEDEPLDEAVKESGMTVEEALVQMERDVGKARVAYEDGSVSETSDILLKIISNAKKVCNQLY